MKILEMQNVLAVRGWRPEKYTEATKYKGGLSTQIMWRVVISDELSDTPVLSKAYSGSTRRPITPWFVTKISALRAAMRILEEQRG